MATLTASQAQSGAQAIAHNGPNRVAGQYTANGSLSASGSAGLLLCKLPPNAEDVRILWNAVHTGATGAKLQFGIKSDDSVSASALQALHDIGVTTTVGPVMGNVYSPTWDDSAGERFKYVQCSVGSGTCSAGFVLTWEVVYNV